MVYAFIPTLTVLKRTLGRSISAFARRLRMVANAPADAGPADESPLDVRGRSRHDHHLRRDLRPLLFHDEDREAAEQQRRFIVWPAPRSEAAVRKEQERRTEDSLPVPSLPCLLGDLATICRLNWIELQLANLVHRQE
jgi:hypothetical protein